MLPPLRTIQPLVTVYDTQQGHALVLGPHGETGKRMDKAARTVWGYGTVQNGNLEGHPYVLIRVPSGVALAKQEWAGQVVEGPVSKISCSPWEVPSYHLNPEALAILKGQGSPQRRWEEHTYVPTSPYEVVIHHNDGALVIVPGTSVQDVQQRFPFTVSRRDISQQGSRCFVRLRGYSRETILNTLETDHTLPLPQGLNLDEIARYGEAYALARVSWGRDVPPQEIAEMSACADIYAQKALAWGRQGVETGSLLRPYFQVYDQKAAEGKEFALFRFRDFAHLSMVGISHPFTFGVEGILHKLFRQPQEVLDAVRGCSLEALCRKLQSRPHDDSWS